MCSVFCFFCLFICFCFLLEVGLCALQTNSHLIGALENVYMGSDLYCPVLTYGRCFYIPSMCSNHKTLWGEEPLRFADRKRENSGILHRATWALSENTGALTNIWPSPRPCLTLSLSSAHVPLAQCKQQMLGLWCSFIIYLWNQLPWVFSRASVFLWK